MAVNELICMTLLLFFSRDGMKSSPFLFWCHRIQRKLAAFHPQVSKYTALQQAEISGSITRLPCNRKSQDIYIYIDLAKLSALNRRDKRNARPALNTNQLESFFLQYRACSNMTFFCTWVLHYDSCPHASVSHWTVHHKDCGDLHEETPKYHWKRTYKQQKRKTICKWEIIGHSTLCCSK